MGAGSVSAGGVVSRTMTRKLAGPALPASSLTVPVTRLSPTANTAPDATGAAMPNPVVRTHSGTSAPRVTRSAAATVNDTAVPAGPAASTVMFGDVVTTGGERSATVTVNVPRLSLPLRS